MAGVSGSNTGSELQTPIFNAFTLPTDGYPFSSNPYSLVSDRFGDIDDKVETLYLSLFGFSDITGAATEGMLDAVDDWLTEVSYNTREPDYEGWRTSIDAIIDELDDDLIGFPQFPAPAIFTTVEIFDDWNVSDSTPSLVWDSGTYQSDIYATLSAKILAGMTTGGTGLPASALQAQWDGGQRRLEADADAKRQIAYNEISSKGFSLPPGALVGRLAELDAEILRLNENLNDTITIENARLAEEYSKFIIEQGSRLEQILREFFTSKITALIAQNEAEVNVWRSILESQIGLITAHAGADIEQYKANVERFKAEIAHHGEYIRAWTDYLKADIDRRNALAQALIAKIDQQLKTYLAFAELKKSGIEFRITTTAQFIASLLNATNTGATTSYTTGERRSESVGHDTSLSESIQG